MNICEYICMSHVTHMNESLYTYELSHVTHLGARLADQRLVTYNNESFHTGN